MSICIPEIYRVRTTGIYIVDTSMKMGSSIKEEFGEEVTRRHVRDTNR